MGLANQLGQFMYGNISLDNNSQLADDWLLLCPQQTQKTIAVSIEAGRG